jgi:Flp pilus assembly protein TadD/arylsulfatase A-like enzyme
MSRAEGRGRHRAAWIAATAATVLCAAAWLASSMRRIDPALEVGVVRPALFGGPRVATGPRVLVPAGLARLERFPRNLVEIPLPAAALVRLEAQDGSHFGFRGTAALRVRSDGWLAAATASGGQGIQGTLADAVRAAARALGPWDVRDALPRSVVSNLERELGARLAERGVDLTRLRFEGVELLTVPKGEAPRVAATSKLLVIGLDGADWEIIDPLIERGRMPNLARLVRNGVRSDLLTISPALSPVVWTSLATGVDPYRHGVLDFLVADPAGGEGQPVTSAQRKVPSVWDLLSDAGVPVGVIGWWATWPAGPVRGYMVTDRVAYQLFGIRPDPAQAEGKTWPADLYAAEIRPHIVAPAEIPWATVETYLDGPRRRPEEFDADETRLLDDFRTLLAATDTYVAVARALRSKHSPRFETVYLEGTDTVGHLFMPYRPPRLRGVEEKRFRSFHAVVDRFYEKIDRDLGLLLEGREQGWTVMVLSDHGFSSGASRPLTTDSRIGHGPAADWHRRFGILVISGDGARAGTRLEEAGIYDVAPTILALFGLPIPVPWPGNVLSEALDAAFLRSYPVTYREDEPVLAAGPGSGGSEPVDPDAAELRERLRSLGYLGSTDSVSVSTTTRNNTGITLLAQGRRAEAEREFRQALEADPDQPVVLVNLGMLLRLDRRDDEARKILGKAVAYSATRRSAGQQLAQLSLEQGDLDGAERYVRMVLAEEPGAAEAVNTLGLVLQKRGRSSEARAAYLESAELDANAAEPRTNLGNLARAAGRFDEAEDWYLKAIEADPYFMGAYNTLALVYQDRRDMKRAIDLYDRALSKSPNHPIVLNNLGSLYYATGERDRAREMWQRAAAADPRYPSPLNNLAGLELGEGNLDEADTLLRKALALDPGYGDARINLALILERQRDVPAARAELEKALADAAAKPRAMVQLGILDLTAGDARSALERLEAARRISPVRDTLLLNAYGEAARRSGRLGDALAAWRESLEIDPSQAELREQVERLAAGNETPAAGVRSE